MVNITASYVNVTYIGQGGKMYSGLVHIQPKMNSSQVMRFINWDQRQGVGSEQIGGIYHREGQNKTNISQGYVNNTGDTNRNFISAATNQLISSSIIPFTTQQPNIIPLISFTQGPTPLKIVSPFFNATLSQNTVVNKTS